MKRNNGAKTAQRSRDAELAFPMRGRWQREALTDEVADRREASLPEADKALTQAPLTNPAKTYENRRYAPAVFCSICNKCAGNCKFLLTEGE